MSEALEEVLLGDGLIDSLESCSTSLASFPFPFACSGHTDSKQQIRSNTSSRKWGSSLRELSHGESGCNIMFAHREADLPVPHTHTLSDHAGWEVV